MPPAPSARIALAALVLCQACYLSHGLGTAGEDSPDASPRGRDTGPTDAGSPPDTALPDAGTPDAGPPREMRWVQLAADAEAPPGRLNHFAVLDHDNDRMILWGGFDPYGERGSCCITPYTFHQDLWTLDLRSETWTRHADLDHVLLSIIPVHVALDAPRDRAVFLAQTGIDGGPAQTWSLDLSTWRLSRLPGGPWADARGPLRAAHDRSRGSLLVHGSHVEGSPRAMWELDLATDRWRDVATRDEPELRFHAPLAVSGPANAFVFGGFGHAGDWDEAELWHVDAGAWRRIALEDAPGGRWSHAMIFEPVRGTLVVFAGQRGGLNRATMLVDPSAGRIREPDLVPSPPPRRDFTMVLDSNRRRAVVFGGALQSSRAHADTWALVLP